MITDLFGVALLIVNVCVTSLVIVSIIYITCPALREAIVEDFKRG